MAGSKPMRTEFGIHLRLESCAVHSALNPGSALNPRTLNPGTTVLVFFINRDNKLEGEVGNKFFKKFYENPTQKLGLKDHY